MNMNSTTESRAYSWKSMWPRRPSFSPCSTRRCRLDLTSRRYDRISAPRQKPFAVFLSALNLIALESNRTTHRRRKPSNPPGHSRGRRAPSSMMIRQENCPPGHGDRPELTPRGCWHYRRSSSGKSYCRLPDMPFRRPENRSKCRACLVYHREH